MLKIVYFWLLNAQIARTTNWTSTLKLYFSSAAAQAAWLRSRRSLHGASFGTLTGRRRGMFLSFDRLLHPRPEKKRVAVENLRDSKVEPRVVGSQGCIFENGLQLMYSTRLGFQNRVCRVNILYVAGKNQIAGQMCSLFSFHLRFCTLDIA